MWVFGYGSLMWMPGFGFTSQSIARLSGYHRALCIRSTHYRGTLARPGLVFGLDWGGVCDGVAFEVASGQAAGVLSALRQRELIYGVYREARVAVTLTAPQYRVVQAITFIAERAHPNYAGPATVAAQAAIVRGAHGSAGANLAYLINTLAHLRELSIRDRAIERVGVLAAAYANRVGIETSSGASARVTALSSAWKNKPCRPAPRRGKLKPGDQHRFGHRAALVRW